MKTAEEIIRHTEQTDFQNGNNKAIISIYQIEEWMEYYAKQESVKFADWLKNECYNYHISFDTYVWRKSNDDINSYTSEEIYDLFIQQQLKQ